MESIETDVASKSVVVHADASVTPEFMLEKLEKVRMSRAVRGDFFDIAICV